MNNLYKMLSFLIMISGTMIAVSSSSWLGAWMGLEINLISFIPLISNSKSIFSSESSMKYFIVQALASTAFLFSILSMMMLKEMNWIMNSISLIFNSALLMKMGAAPFHFWFPEIMSKLNWPQSLILLTWQKIAPMSLISYSIKMNSFMFLIIITSVMIGSIIGLNQTSTQKIMAYSSINHIGWMLSSMMINEMIWLIYFMTYTMISASLIYIMKIMNINHLKQLFFSMNNNPMIKFAFIINFLSLGGLPPFLGFFPKWIIIQNLIFSNMNLLIFIMIMFTLITLFFYLRVTFSILSISYEETNWKPINKINKMIIVIINSLSLMGLLFSTLIINMI